MGMPVYVEYPETVTVGAQAPINLDWMIAPFSVAVGLFVPSGTTVSCTLEVTYDNLNAPGMSAATADWFTDEGFGTASASKEVTLSRPVLFLRLNIASISGGPVRLKVVQGFAID